MDDLGIEPLGIEPLGDSLGIEPLGIEPLEAPKPAKARKGENYGNEGRRERTINPEDNMALRGADLAGGVLETLTTGLVKGVGSAVAMGAGGAAGLVTPGMTAKEGMESAVDLFNKYTPYLNPETNAGKKFEHKVGQLIESFKGYAADPAEIKQLISAIPFAGQHLKEDEALQAVVSGLGSSIPEVAGILTLPTAPRTVRGRNPQAEPSVARKTSIDDILAKKTAKVEADLGVEPLTPAGKGQLDMFGFDNTEGMASQFNPNQAVEPIAPLRQRRQMELPMGKPGAGPMTQTADGILNHPANAELFKARDMREEVLRRQLDAEQQQRAPGQLFPEDPYQGQLADQGPQLPAQAPVAPARGGLSDRRQMGFDFRKEEPMQVTPRGQVLRGVEDAGAARAAEEAYFARRAREMENAKQTLIDDTQHAGEGELYGAQYGTEKGVGRVDENGMPIRADLSMEAQNLQNPLQRNLWGDELGPSAGQQRSLTEALDSLPDSPIKGDARDAALAALGEPRATSNLKSQRGHVNEDVVAIVRTSTGYVAKVGNKVIGKLDSNMTPEQSAMLAERGMGEPASVDIVRVDQEARGKGVGKALYDAWTKDHGGNVMPSGKTTADAWAYWKRNQPEKVEAFVKQEAHRAAANPEVLRSITDDTVRRQVAEAVDQLKIDEPAIMYEPGVPVGQYKKQGGYIKMPWEKKAAVEEGKKLPGIMRGMQQFQPEPLRGDQFIERYKGSADMEQNAAQRFANNFTKSGDYQAEKTGNPIVKMAAEELKGAVNRSQAAQRIIVHDNYAKMARNLSDQQLTDAWMGLEKQRISGHRLTADELEMAGYSKPEREFMLNHNAVMDNMLTRLNEGLVAAGHKPVTAEAAHTASKAVGNFRQIMYKTVDGEKVVAGVLGADTKLGLARDVKKFQEHFPDTEGGPVSTHMGGGRKSNIDPMLDALNFLEGGDPVVAEFMSRMKQLSDEAAVAYRGTKTHTMAKKGVPGMPGNRPWESAYKNAKAGVEAQVSYMNRVIEMAELAKAKERLDPILNSPDLDMPAAKQWARDKMDTAFGRNPTDLGNALDSSMRAVANWSGVGTNVFNKIGGGLRQATNTLLLSMNPGFLIGNALDPVKGVPGLTQYLKSVGVSKAGGTGLMYNYKALLDVAKQKSGMKLDPVIEGALRYADENHVYASDLYENSNAVRKDAGYYGKKITQGPAGLLETASRQNVFLGFVNMLKERSNLTPDKGLYDAALRATDMVMNTYSTLDSPLATQALGAAGRGPYNLLSYKANTLSRLSMFARDMKMEKPSTWKPMATEILSQVAFGGLKGTILYQEADFIVRQLSKMLGNPTSLSKILLDNKNKVLASIPVLGDVTVGDLGSGALSTATGVDFSNRMGVGAITGDLSDPLNLLMPGSSAMVDAVGSTWNAITKPSEYNTKKFIVQAIPGGKLMERKWFSQNYGTDNEMGINKNTMEAGAVRTPSDKVAKSMGMTGLNEADTRNARFENKLIDKWYEDKQAAAVDRMAQSFFTSGSVDKKAVEDFVKAQGNPDNLGKALETMAMRQNIPAHKLEQLKIAAQNTITSGQKMKRRFY